MMAGERLKAGTRRCDVNALRSRVCVTSVTLDISTGVIASRLQLFSVLFAMASSEIAQCLSATLSPDTNTRIAAELKLGGLLNAPG